MPGLSCPVPDSSGAGENRRLQSRVGQDLGYVRADWPDSAAFRFIRETQTGMIRAVSRRRRGAGLDELSSELRSGHASLELGLLPGLETLAFENRRRKLGA